MSDDTKPDIDIEAERKLFRQWASTEWAESVLDAWEANPADRSLVEEWWQAWLARARLAAEREREMVDLLLEAQREGCTRCCYPHSAQCLRITAALKKGPSDDRSTERHRHASR